MLGTGGTIASEMTPDGLTPELRPAQLLKYVPAIKELCNVDCLSLFNIDSTNITPRHWCAMAAALEENYDRYDGFVISHGTDTMAYTAAALSYMVQGADKPIMITGAQKPINYDSTDSTLNLPDAFVCACSEELAGGDIVFSGRGILGTRARKTCSKSFAAFSSINYPDLAILQDHRPSYEDSRRFDLVQRHTAAGKFIVMTTQVQNEGSDLSVYSVGHRLKSNPYVLEGFDMTTEAVYAKMMWILAQTHDVDAVNRLFYTPVAHDILRRN